MRNTMTVLVTLTLAATMACGGAPLAGPSPMAEVQPAAAQPAARALPAGLDPAYVSVLAANRWTGGPFHHCFSVDPSESAIAEAAAQRITAISGIPRTESGHCNVEWVTDKAVGHTYTNIGGSPDGIIHATVYLRSANSLRDMLHEAGHILGLADGIDSAGECCVHSPRPDDLMNMSPRVQDFSRDELAVLAWIYGR